MSNPDKHTPLSPEELFKLLDSQSSKASEFDELDDFEKEALDGFTAHSNAQKAKALTEELNIAISKKIIASEKGSSKNKLIWFSAAASIALVITMSVFFFNQSKDDTKTNLALNEAQDNVPQPKQLETEKPLKTISDDNANSSEQKEPQFQAPLKSQETIISRNTATRSIAVLGTSTAFAVAENKPEFAYDALAKDESKNRTEGESDDRLKQADGLLDMVDGNSKTKIQPSIAAGSAAGKEKNKLSEEQVNNEMQANQSIATNLNSTNTKTTTQEDGYYKADKSVAHEQSKKKAEKSAKLSKDSADLDKANTAPVVYRSNDSAPSSIADKKTSSAYYLGSELAIRDYVLNYLKEKQSNKSIAGIYKIKGVVSIDGKLKVSSIVQSTKVNCLCEDIITEALNTMIKWNSALEDGKKVSSNVEFLISF